MRSADIVHVVANAAVKSNAIFSNPVSAAGVVDTSHNLSQGVAVVLCLTLRQP
jgi:hypothetical protein